MPFSGCNALNPSNRVLSNIDIQVEEQTRSCETDKGNRKEMTVKTITNRETCNRSYEQHHLPEDAEGGI